MAGAVSAGAYTAGVIDYLMETLQKWEEAKKTGEKNIPDDYEVIIEVVSGASAGGITSALMPFTFTKNYRPVNHENRAGKDNLLYDCWVNMVDRPDASMIDQLLDTVDLPDNDSSATEVQSFLNSQPIDAIADKAMAYSASEGEQPPFISDDLDIVLTVTNLKGLDFYIEYKSYQNSSPSKITMHSGYFRYRLGKDESDDYLGLNLKLDHHKEELIAAAKCTSAFPLGLKARKKEVQRKYIEKYAAGLFPEHQNKVRLSNEVLNNAKYDFIAVDGGMINNEPLGYSNRFLKEKLDSVDDPHQKDYSLILIDPFPSHVSEDILESSTGLLSIFPQLVRTLRNQVMFKQDDLFEALSDDNSDRFLIEPTRKKEGKLVDNPIACGALGGFSGFFDRKFRQHDFELGRRNCQSFIRYYFAKKESENHYIHAAWTEEMKDRFRFFRKDIEGNQISFLPIIPDPDVLVADRKPENNFQSVYKVPFEQPMEFPQYPVAEFSEFKAKLRKRLKAVLPQLVLDFNHGAETEYDPEEDFFLMKFKGYQRLNKRFLNWVKKRGAIYLGKRFSKEITKVIRKDFRSYGLLDESKLES